jgi:hypothetical protein
VNAHFLKKIVNQRKNEIDEKLILLQFFYYLVVIWQSPSVIMTQLFRRCRVFSNTTSLANGLSKITSDAEYGKNVFDELANKIVTPEHIRSISTKITSDVIDSLRKDAFQDIDPTGEVILSDRMLYFLSAQRNRNTIIENIDKIITDLGDECECPLPGEDCNLKK